MIRKRMAWKIGGDEITLGVRTMIMGVLDLSEDAFPGRPDPERCLAEAQRIEEEGADFLDVSAASLRHGPRPSADEELSRLVPVLRKLHNRCSIPFSVNTTNAETAARAIELGAAIISDPSGLSADPKMAKTLSTSDAGLVAAHMRGVPEQWSRQTQIAGLVDTVLSELDSTLGRARLTGIDPRRVVIDPGLGLGKRGGEDFLLLDGLKRAGELGRPILVSPSRKPFLTESVKASEEEWLIGAAVVAALAVRGGAHIVRGREVGEIALAAKLADRMLAALEVEE